METTIKIKPVNYSVDKLEIHSIALKLDKGAKINCVVKGEIINIHNTIDLTEEEYAGWGTDDNYIVDLLMSKLGLEKA